MLFNFSGVLFPYCEVKAIDGTLFIPTLSPAILWLLTSVGGGGALTCAEF